MFILSDKHDRRLDTVPFRAEELVYLYKNEHEEEKYPLLSQIDTTSPTCFGSEDMAQLISELEAVKSPAEMQRMRQRHKEQILEGVLSLKVALKRFKNSIWSIDAEKRLHTLTAELEKISDGIWDGLADEIVSSHLDAIIRLARRCQADKNLFLSHTPT